MKIIIPFVVFFMTFGISAAQVKGLLYASPNSVMTISNNATLQANSNITLGNNAHITQNGSGTINIIGTWTNNGGTFTPGSGTINFISNLLDSICGTSSTTFNIFNLNKTNPANFLYINSNFTTNSDLTLTNGNLIYDNSTAARTVTVNGNVTISTTSTFNVMNTGVARSHQLLISGNLTNSNILNFFPAAGYLCGVTFTGNSNSIISGAGATNSFNTITTNKSSQATEVQVTANVFTVPAAGFLTLNGGTFHILGSFVLTNPVFATANYSIPGSSGYWQDNSNVTVSGQNGNATLAGLLKISSGIYNVGIAGNQNSLLYSNGAQFTLQGGNVNINTAFTRDATNTSTITYNQTAGNIFIGTGTQSNSTTRGCFDIGAVGSTFNWSGGIIEINRPSANTSNPPGDVIILAGSGSVAASTLLRINASTAGQTININASQPVGELLMLAANNPIVQLSSNNLTVLGNVTIAGTGAGRLNSNNLNITLGGNWNNNGGTANTAFTGGTGVVTLNGSGTQTIGGTQTTTFSGLSVNSSASSLLLGVQTIVSAKLRLISNTLLDIQTNNLYLSDTVYSDNSTGITFSPTKTIFNSQGINGGRIALRFNSAPTLPFNFRIPMGTTGTPSNVYTPVQLTYQASGVSFSAYPADILFRPVPSEHPNVVSTGVSLKKYWQVTTNNVTVSGSGVSFIFNYDQTEVQGSEGSYSVLQYVSPNWNIDPGSGPYVSTSTNLIYALFEQNPVTGDWTAGSPAAARATYYSIANGNYSDPNSWSKVSYGGAVSNTAPGNVTDIVYIGDNKTITLNANIAAGTAPKAIYLQSSGTFITSTFQVNSDTLSVQSGSTLGIGDPNGITAAPTASGNVRSNNRIFSSGACYVYNGSANQVTGTGLPLTISSLVLSEPAGISLSLSNSFAISDSLVINNGILIVSINQSVDGSAAGKKMIMRGGELRIGTNFPNNYTAPNFTAGTINFNGANSPLTIPSSSSTPGVYQFYNLTIGGARAGSLITFSTSDSIKVGGALTLPATFDNFNTPRFLTTGSTVVFNGTGSQTIPRVSGTAGANYELNYYNLVISGTGTKTLGDAAQTVNHDISIQTGATFDVSTFGLTIGGNWTMNGGSFNPNAQTVTFNVNTAATVKYIISQNKPFNNVIIAGIGTNRYDDSLQINGNLTINLGSELRSNSPNLTLKGNWNDQGLFTPSSGNVTFGSTTGLQTLTATSTETFYNLNINNTAGNVRLAAGTSVVVNDSLNFTSGNLDTRTNNTFVSVLGSATRSGTGHVDGNLRINIPSGATSGILYPIGNGNSYTPFLLTMSGAGGTTGLLNIISRAPESQALANSGLTAPNTINRQWDVLIPATSSFALGARTYNTLITFVPGNVPGGDVIVGTNTANYEIRRWVTSWIAPTVGNRTNTSTEALNNNLLAAAGSIATFVIGLPSALTYYSINTGNWNASTTWSTAGYGGATSGTTPSSADTVRIGDGKNVTLTGAVTVNSGIYIETAGPSNTGGRLDCQTNVISGSGVFNLLSGGALGIGSPQGITTAGANGNIQMTTRNYNPGAHNNGVFIYTASGGAQATGNGLPATVKSLTINNSGQIVTLTAGVTITDSIYIQAGTLNVNTFDLIVGGNWRNSGTFNPGGAARLVTFNGAANQIITNTSNETFNNLTINKASGLVRLNSSTNITINNTLTFTSGNIDSRTNSQVVILASGGNVSRTSGYVDGEFRKNVPTGAISITFEVGNSTYYTPVTLATVGAGGTAGLIAVNSIAGNQANFGPLVLDTNKNVQRYWHLTIPGGSGFALGGRTYNLTLTFINPDDIRGGANTANFVMKRWDGAVWNNTTNGVRSGTTTQATGITVYGTDFMIGEAPGASRTFYTRADGNWNTPSTWSEIGYGQTATANWPNLTTDNVYIANGNTVTMGAAQNVASVIVEAVGGTGTLDFGNNVLSGGEFSLKSGGKIKIGSAAGITTAGLGNVQTTIRNYNYGTNNSGNFVYTTSAGQSTGNGLPAIVASLEINNSGNTVALTNPVSVSGNLTITAGTFNSNGSAITVNGNWVNNSAANAFTAGAQTVTLSGSSDQSISGSFSTSFNNLTLSNTGGNINLNVNTTVNGTLNFTTNTLLVVSTNDLTIGTAGTISGSGLGSTQMIKTTGASNGGRVIKIYPTGTSAQSITIPIGVNSDYNPMVLNLTATYAANATAALRLRSGTHPNKYSTSVLSKYWNITTSGISSITANTLQFNYLPTDVNGNQSIYIPGLYAASGWIINLGSARSANPSPISITNQTTALGGIDGDWTAGEPTSIISGTRFWSRATGTWSLNTNWSNDVVNKFTGAACAYPPGTFNKDTVYIGGGFTITYSNLADTISLMAIGGAGSNGTLSFLTGTNKMLNIIDSLAILVNGTIGNSGATTRYDTLYLMGNLYNENNTANAADFRTSATQLMILDFVGSKFQTITGAGRFRLSSVILGKTGLTDTLANLSSQFSTDWSTAITGNVGTFSLNKGIYRHDNAGSSTLLRSTGGSFFIMGVNTGFDIRQGSVSFLDNLQTNTNTTINISGGNLNVGNAQNLDFIYETGTTFTMTGGNMTISGCFRRNQTTSGLTFNLKGGTLTTVNVGSNRFGGLYGFDISPTSYFNVSDSVSPSRIIYAFPTSADYDYLVNTTLYNIKGGTLQFGIVGNYTGGSYHSLGSKAPIYNLEVVETRASSGNDRALILLDVNTTVINSVIIRSTGTLDLNGNNLKIGHNFMNYGKFTTDGTGWQTGGSRQVTFNGTANDTICILNTINNPNNGADQNEAFFDLIFDKSSGNVTIDTVNAATNSNVTVRNNLIFTNNNTAIIDTRTFNKYVQMVNQSAGDLMTVQRFGLGHINGALRKQVATGAVSYTFEIGTSSDYTSAKIDLIGAGGTQGMVEMISYGNDAANIATNGIGLDLTRNVQRYWKIQAPVAGFALGGRTYNLTTNYIYPGDIRNSALWSNFKHFRAFSTPYVQLTPGTRTAGSVQSTGVTAGLSAIATPENFVIADFTGIKYYTRLSGNWSTISTWSNAGYGGAIASAFPSLPSDEVHIGAGNTVTLDVIDTVGSVSIEKTAAGPGKLITGDYWINGTSFILNDSCILQIKDPNGLKSIPTPLGAIRTTNIRSFGNANYIYANDFDDMKAGDALPPTILSLTVNNTASQINNLFLSNYTTVIDSIKILSGQFDCTNNQIDLKGNFILNNNTNYLCQTALFRFIGTGPQSLVLNNNGITFYQLGINKLSGYVQVSGSNSSANVTVTNKLSFQNGNLGVIDTRTNNRLIYIQNPAFVERLGVTPFGHVNGTLRKYVISGANSTLFEVGDSTVYAPATLVYSAGAGSVSGYVDAINYPSVPHFPFYDNRMDTVMLLNRYWSLIPVNGSGYSLGITINSIFEFPTSEIKFDSSKSVVRRKSIPAETYLWTERKGLTDLEWDSYSVAGRTNVRLAALPTPQWLGIGEFYIGQKSQRIFWSRQNGNWEDSLSWSFYPGGLPNVPTGQYPNYDWNYPAGYVYETRDSVIIQNSNVITINSLPQLASLNIKNLGKLIIPSGIYLSQSPTGVSIFSLNDTATLENKTIWGIESDTSISVLKFYNLTFSNTGNYIFSGSLPQKFGTSFPGTMRHLTITNTGIGTNGFVSSSSGTLNVNGNLTINSGELRAFDNSTNFRLAGNLTVNGNYDGTMNTLGNPINSTFTFQGSGAIDQLVSGSGKLNLYNMTMNRGAGVSILQLNITTNVSGVFNLQEAANPNPQIIALGTNNDIIINNNLSASLINYNGTAPLRYIRTSTTSGQLTRLVTQNNSYTFPIGSYDAAIDNYTPATFTSGNSGTDGKIGIRVSRGTNAISVGGHLRLTNLASDWLKRYWAVDSVTTTIPGILHFSFNNNDLAGNVNNMIGIGRWRPSREGAAGFWAIIPGNIVPASNYFESPVSYAASGFAGDWTIANMQAFLRIFYSLASGNWNSDQSWTFNSTHSGSPVGGGMYPNISTDSVVIGGGNLGIGNHVISLNINPPAIGGVQLGTSSVNSGTLDCGLNVISGTSFTMNDYSLLKVGSPNGITLAPALSGNIQTTNRTYGGGAIYTSFEYNGNSNQVPGNGLPLNVRNFTVTNTGLVGNNTLTLDKSLTVNGDVTVNSGRLDLSTFSLNRIAVSGNFTLASGSTLRIDGPKDLLSSANNYNIYNINTASLIEFYGTSPNDQTISNLPAKLTSGLGNVLINNSGTKFVAAPLLIKGNLQNANGATLQNNVGVNSLQVLGNVINNANIKNNGVFEIGN